MGRAGGKGETEARGFNRNVASVVCSSRGGGGCAPLGGSMLEQKSGSAVQLC